MNATAIDKNSVPPKSSCKRAGRPRFKHRQEVELLQPRIDGQGRVVALAGSRGFILEELDTCRGWWLVQYEATQQVWPTPVDDLRPAVRRLPGRIGEQPLLAVLRVLLRSALIEQPSEVGDCSLIERAVPEILAYLTGHGEAPDILGQLVVEWSGGTRSCGCLGDGVCSACNGRGRNCPTCQDSRICPGCPRLQLRFPELETLQLPLPAEPAAYWRAGRRPTRGRGRKAA